jgi:D-alanyl-D-alanine carboxypeptidase
MRSLLVALLTPALLGAQSPDEQAVRAVIDQMFSGMRSADSAAVRAAFVPGARFASIDARQSPPIVRYDSVDGWINGIANSNKRWDEQIYDVQIRVDNDMAHAWTPYTFYLDRKWRHCGVNSMELLKVNGAWKLTQLSDTRRRDNCRDPLGTGPATATPRPPEVIQQALQTMLDSTRAANRWPGASLAVALPDGRLVSVASGMADTTAKTPLRTSDRLLSGSVGKTYVAAVALQLVQEGKLDLDAKISTYLGNEPWFNRLPNARDITVRQLMNHTSGLVRYEFQPAAAESLKAKPMKVWTPVDRLTLIFDTPAPFAAGAGWEYSDTNYIVLGMIIEKLTGRPYYDELRRRILVPLALANTIPSDRPLLPGVANGYAGPKNDLGGYDASISNGRMAINPQFEWTGGGIASTTSDLAHWAKLLYEGKAFAPELLPQMMNGVPARLGPNTRYGLAAILRETQIGSSVGHSGFFPGYATEMMYWPATRVAAALQVNVTDPYPRGMGPLLVRAARIVRGE